MREQTIGDSTQVLQVDGKQWRLDEAGEGSRRLETGGTWLADVGENGPHQGRLGNEGNDLHFVPTASAYEGESLVDACLIEKDAQDPPRQRRVAARKGAQAFRQRQHPRRTGTGAMT